MTLAKHPVSDIFGVTDNINNASLCFYRFRLVQYNIPYPNCWLVAVRQTNQFIAFLREINTIQASSMKN